MAKKMLVGAEQLCKHAKMGESTLMDAIFNRDFPAKRNNEDRWEAPLKEVNLWMKKQRGGDKEATKKSHKRLK